MYSDINTYELNKATVDVGSALYGSIYGAQKAFFMAKGFIIDKQSGFLLTNRHVANKTLLPNLGDAVFMLKDSEDGTSILQSGKVPDQYLSMGRFSTPSIEYYVELYMV